MKLGSLFSGGGLGDFGFMAAGMEIRWQVEIDEYCQKILALRYPDSKKYQDIKILKGEELEPVDIITGGFPCQPFSIAGKQRGIDDERNLWPSMFKILSEVKPNWVIGENVPGIINLALDNVLHDLENIGYETATFIFPAHALGAPHKRERMFIIANANGSRLQKPWAEQQTNRFGQLEQDKWRQAWKIKPSMDRVVDGCANRMERLKMLGNGQVPACTYVIGKMIMEIESNLTTPVG